jgi:hypothetical protein
MGVTSERINTALKDHQIHLDKWNYQALVVDLHTWADRFILEFKLQCGTPAIRVDQLRNTCYGHFHLGRNGFGVVNEIAINESYLRNRDYWEVLGTLLHELIHAEQQESGTLGKSVARNYHNNAFIERAKQFGLIVNRKGQQYYQTAPSPFMNILQKYGAKIPRIVDKPPKDSGRGNSKLKLWECACVPKPVKIRVAIKDFRAKCLKCGKIFVRID